MEYKQQLDDYKSALARLQDSYQLANENQELYPYLRDSTIQRFEFTIEICWKTIKKFLLEHEGIECRSPKSCIRDFLHSGYISKEEGRILLHMIDDRNLASHTYHESIAEEIFANIGKYIDILEKVFDRIA